jgi:hypothetical protein
MADCNTHPGSDACSMFSPEMAERSSQKKQSPINMNEHDDSTPGIQAASGVNGPPDETE